MITFKEVSKTFYSDQEKVHALNKVNLQIEKGEIYGVIGFSGAGKSTLLRCVNLLEKPTNGSIIVNGQDLTSLKASQLQQAKRNIGMIFQHFNLLHSKTVFENVAMPLKLVKASREDIKKRVNSLLDFVGLKEKADNYPDQLSGGQKQRIGIARALATNPSILLCDEATSALDPETTNSILQLLKEINVTYNITILMITHEMHVIREVCDKVAVMEDGQVIEEGTVLDVFSKPKHTTTKNFVRSVIQDEIPNSIKKLLRNQSDKSKIYKIEFIGDSSGSPFLSELVRKFEVDVNVLFGNITEIQDIPFGSLIVQITGDKTNIEQSVVYIEQQSLVIKEVNLADA